jgi:DNA-binding transcriptional LysR family regulator
MRDTKLAELTALIAVAERRNFTRAAADLRLAPSTLSQTIRSLEERLGVRLLHRTTRSVSVTAAGERLLARIRPAVEELDEAVQALNDFRHTPTGTLRLSVSSIPAQMIIAPLLKDFMQAYPAIHVDITVDDSDSDIVHGRFDAGIRYGRRIEKDMLLIRASPESRIVAVASPAYLEAHPAPQTPHDLHRHACILFRYDNQRILAWEFARKRKRVEVAVSGPLIVNDVDLMVRAACDGIGIGYTVEAYVADKIAQGRLVPLLVDWSPVHHSYYLYHASRRHLPTPLKVFIDFLGRRAQAGPHSPA